MSQNYWLLKSEPNAFSIDDLKACPRKTDKWDGVRNYQARNFLKSMAPGDLAFFYHSNCAVPGIVGIVEVSSDPYPDPTAFDKRSKYFDEKSTHENPRWFLVDVTFKRKFKDILSLADIKANPRIKTLPLIQKGSRLSVMPVSAQEWEILLKMGE